MNRVIQNSNSRCAYQNPAPVKKYLDIQSSSPLIVSESEDGLVCAFDVRDLGFKMISERLVRENVDEELPVCFQKRRNFVQELIDEND